MEGPRGPRPQRRWFASESRGSPWRQLRCQLARSHSTLTAERSGRLLRPLERPRLLCVRRTLRRKNEEPKSSRRAVQQAHQQDGYRHEQASIEPAWSLQAAACVGLCGSGRRYAGHCAVAPVRDGLRRAEGDAQHRCARDQITSPDAHQLLRGADKRAETRDCTPPTAANCRPDVARSPTRADACTQGAC
jgi:hypothetical protein